MNWESFYLICFLVGLSLSVRFVAGRHGTFRRACSHAACMSHVPHVPQCTFRMARALTLRRHRRGRRGGCSVVERVFDFDFSLLVWRGGYLLTRYGNFVGGVVLVLAAVCGLAGGAIIFLFLTKVLLPHERELTADETDVVGAVGRVSSAIRAGGTGEIVYQQMGAVRSAFARSDDGEPIPKQEEVYVIRYEKGVAYVRRWDDQWSQ